MPEVLAAPRVITGDEAVRDGAVVIGDRTVDWAGPAAALPAEYAALPRADYPDSTILPGLIDSHVHLGLDGGPDGLDGYRAIAAHARRILAADGILAVELGFGQAAAVGAVFAAAGLACSEPQDDLSGVPRALIARPLP